MIFLGGGVVVSLKTLTGTAPYMVKVPEIAAAMGVAAVFGLFRYPLDMQGDRVTTWLRRGARYLRRGRRGSMFAGRDSRSA
ncbi:MAG: hypothetical protein M0Z66_16675 [Thermaerobacter sp.]|nr:hypothetical protein [Thermaerobacter sp.]